MNRTEQRLKAAGAVLIRINKHRIYELNGERFTLSHSKKGQDRDRMKPLERLLDRIEQAAKERK